MSEHIMSIKHWRAVREPGLARQKQHDIGGKNIGDVWMKD